MRLITRVLALALSLHSVLSWRPHYYHHHHPPTPTTTTTTTTTMSSTSPPSPSSSRATRGDVLRGVGLGLMGSVLGVQLGGSGAPVWAAERSRQEIEYELFKRALTLTQQFQFSEAEKVYTEIVDMFGSSDTLDEREKTVVARAYSNRGNCRAALDKVESALVDYSRALDLSPDVSEFWLNRGLCYETIGDRMLYSDEGKAIQFYKVALSDYSHASVLAPSDPKVYITMGDVQMHLGQFDQALENYRLGVALSPSSPSTRGKVALSEVQVGNFEKGAFIVDSILKRNPDYAEMRLASAAMDWTSGRFVEGLDMFTDAIMRDPRLFDMRYLRMNLHWPPAMLSMVGALMTAGTTQGYKAQAVGWFEVGQQI